MRKAQETRVRVANPSEFEGQYKGCNAEVGFRVVEDGIDGACLVYGVHFDGDFSLYHVPGDDPTLRVGRQVVLSRETALAFARSILEAYYV